MPLPNLHIADTCKLGKGINLYFVSEAVKMTRYFKPCNSNYMIFERLLAALHLDIFNRLYIVK